MPDTTGRRQGARTSSKEASIVAIRGIAEHAGDDGPGGMQDLTGRASWDYTLVDVALHLPKSWTDDADRRAEAGVPDAVTFATKP